MNIINQLIDHKIITEEDRDIYEYGYANFRLYAIFIIFVFIGNIILKNYLYTIIFLICVFQLRRFSGGFHLSDSNSCLFLSTVITLIIPILCQYYDFDITYKIIIQSVIMMIFIFLPVVDTHNKVLSDKEKAVYKRKLMFHVFIDNIILVVCLLMKLNDIYMVILYSMLLVIISSIIGYLLKRVNIM